MMIARSITWAFIASIALAVFLWVESSPPKSDAALFDAPISADQVAIRDELLALLADLKTISLDTSTFDDPRYRSLVDWSVEIESQPVGRRNPFLPVGVGE